MKRKTWRALALFLCSVAVLSLAGNGLALSGGAPSGKTAAPGEGDCTSCHSDYPLDSGAGALSISGVPADYIPSQDYTITVTLSQAGAQRWGFEATAVLADGDAAGTLVVTDATNTSKTTGTVGSNTRQYVTHTSAGTHAGTADGPVSWSFSWTAPVAGSGTVTFHAAGNAADNGGSTAGDYIYTATATSDEGTSGPATAPTITLASPQAGEIFVQREKHFIGWTMTDADGPSSQLTVYLNYSSDAGSGVIAGPLIGDTGYVWIVPDGLEAEALVIEATVVDPDGLSGSSQSQPVTVIPPNILPRPFLVKFWAPPIYFAGVGSVFLLWWLSERRRHGRETA